MKFPPFKARIPFDGLLATKFWIRVFGLEPELAFAQAKINEKAERKTASVPIVNDYEVSENLHFYYAMTLTVDILGLQDGIGMIFATDKENAAQVIKHRDELAERIMESLKKRGFEEEIEIYLVPPKKENLDKD